MKTSVAALGLVTAAALCWVGLRNHKVRRAHPLGGWRCEVCKRFFGSLDDIGESDRVSPLRPIYSRDGAGGHAETSSEEVQ